MMLAPAAVALGFLASGASAALSITNPVAASVFHGASAADPWTFKVAWEESVSDHMIPLCGGTCDLVWPGVLDGALVGTGVAAKPLLVRLAAGSAASVRARRAGGGRVSGPQATPSPGSETYIHLAPKLHKSLIHEK